MTLDELKEQLRQHGVVNFSEVRSAFMESDGKFSVIRYRRDDTDHASAAGDRQAGVR